MDRKSLLILVVAGLLYFALMPVVDHFFPPKPAPLVATVEFTNQVGKTFSTSSNGASMALTESLTVSSAPEQIVAITNDDVVYRFTSVGGGMQSIALRRYPAVINRTGATLLETNEATLNSKAPAPLLALLGSDIQGDNDFHLTQNGATVTAEKTLTNGLRLVKEFTIESNYLFTAVLRLENTSDRPLDLPARDVVIGTATAIGPQDDPSTLGTIWYDGMKATSVDGSWFANRALGCLPGTPRSDYQEGANNVVWGSVHNQFFTLAAIPTNSAPRFVVHKIIVSPPPLVGLTNNTSASLTNGYEAAFWYPATILPAHQTTTSTYTFYAGPKEYRLLAKIAQRMNNNVDLLMGFSWVRFFSKLLLLSMNGLHDLGLGYGWTIIAITLIIKIVFWPLTNASIKSQKRMQALQPQLKAIAEKYKDDPVKKNQKTMDFMKEHKVSPLGSCLPTALQIPVFLGFYWMLRNAIELRGVPFLWAHDLSQPDTVAFIPFLNNFPINPLPLIMGATQLWQAQLLPPSPGMDPGQQKMMRYMPLMFIAFLYRMSAGLTLYWTFQNLLSVLQTKLTKTTDETKAVAVSGPPRKRTSQ